MPVFSRLVVGLDGSKTALDALEWAADRVTDTKKIAVVHSGSPDPEVPEFIDVGSIHSRDCEPAKALLAAACEHNADAIVIGPHGSGMGRGLGSVARELLREATIPVVVVDGHDRAPATGSKAPVVACVGYGEPAEAAAHWAAAYAADHGLPLVLLHAVAYRPLFPIDAASDVLASYLGTGVSTTWAMEDLKAIGGRLHDRFPDIAITAHAKPQSVIKAVQEAGKTAEVVVLGKRNQEEFRHIIGTPRLRHLVARSNFPTVVVPISAGS